MRRPPDAPSARNGAPPRDATTGHMFESGRLAGASEFGRPGRGSNHITPLFIRMPVRGSRTLLPNSESSVWVRATRLPCRSTTLRWEVQDGAGSAGAAPPIRSA
jgi:hypothetical protein